MSARRRRQATGVLGIIGAVAVAVPAAGADGLPANCSQAGTTVTCAFAPAGAEQIFTVPAGVTSVTITATGAPGGGNGLISGGVAGTASATAGVASGSRLYVEVGGAGTVGGGSGSGAGGFNGGGAGGTGGNGNGGGGGGASDVRTVSCGGACPGSGGTLSSRLVVAAGGGGSGAVGPLSPGGTGGAAEAPGGVGADDSDGDGGGDGGGAATASGGGPFGAGGTAALGGTDGDDGTPGTAGQGGAGAGQTNGGGGGGGGLYGGGGGGGGSSRTAPSFNEAGAGGGGGGSSYAPGGTTGLAAPGAPAAVTIAYTIPTPQPTPPPAPQPPPAPLNPPTVTITKPKANATFAQRQRVVVQYSCHDGANAPGIQTCAGPVASGSPLDTKKPGRHVFTVVATSKDGQTASRSLVYRVAAPASKTLGERGNAKLVLAHGKTKLTVIGNVSAASGEIQGPVKIPGTCKSGFCQTKQLGPKTAGTITLIAELTGHTKKKLESLKPLTHTWKRATLSLTYTEGLSSMTLSYALDSPVIASTSIGSIKAGSKAHDQLTLKIAYEKMTSAGCLPKSSCGV